MKEETKTVIIYRLERANESLRDAKNLFEGKSLNSSVNRIYYAMFYAVNALLLTKNLSSSRHSGVRVLFFKEFVNKREVEEKDGKFYSEIFEKRQLGDYKDMVRFERKDVEIWLNKAEVFVKRIEELTLKIIQQD